MGGFLKQVCLHVTNPDNFRDSRECHLDNLYIPDKNYIRSSTFYFVECFDRYKHVII